MNCPLPEPSLPNLKADIYCVVEFITLPKVFPPPFIVTPFVVILHVEVVEVDKVYVPAKARSLVHVVYDPGTPSPTKSPELISEKVVVALNTDDVAMVTVAPSATS